MVYCSREDDFKLRSTQVFLKGFAFGDTPVFVKRTKYKRLKFSWSGARKKTMRPVAKCNSRTFTFSTPHLEWKEVLMSISCAMPSTVLQTESSLPEISPNTVSTSLTALSKSRISFVSIFTRSLFIRCSVSRAWRNFLVSISVSLLCNRQVIPWHKISATKKRHKCSTRFTPWISDCPWVTVSWTPEIDGAFSRLFCFIVWNKTPQPVFGKPLWIDHFLSKPVAKT